MRLLLIALVVGLTLTFVLAKRVKARRHAKHESHIKKASKPTVEAVKSQKGLKKQFMGYPEPDSRQSVAQGSFGQGGFSANRYGGMGNGGLGSEMEGMPVGMGGGGEPLGYKDHEDSHPRIPGISNGPANYDDNAEVGRGGDDEDSSYLGRFSKQGDMDTLTKGALSRLDSPDQDSSYQLDKEREREEGGDEQPDALVTKAIGRPFQPDNGEEGEQMDNRQDSPFQQVKQENPFGVPMDSLASQMSFANQQMSPIRPGYEGGRGEPFGQEQREVPSRELQPPQGDERGDVQGLGQSEGSDFRATSMSGGDAMMRMGEQEGGNKRHELSGRAKKIYRKTLKQKSSSSDKNSKRKAASKNQ